MALKHRSFISLIFIINIITDKLLQYIKKSNVHTRETTITKFSPYPLHTAQITFLLSCNLVDFPL